MQPSTVRRLVRLSAVLLIALAMAAPLAACGKKGANKPPEDATYPRTYPTR